MGAQGPNSPTMATPLRMGVMNSLRHSTKIIKFRGQIETRQVV